MGLLLEVGSLSLFLPAVHMAFCSPLYSYPCISLFFYLSGVGSAKKKASSLREEAHRLEAEAQHLETEGLGKTEAAVAGSEAESSYGLLRGAMSHPSISSASPPHKKACHTPSTTVSHLPLGRSQEQKSPILQTRQGSLPLQLSFKLQRRQFLPTCNPFAFSWGGIKWVPG